MEGRTESEKQGISLLGNQGTKYPQDYAPEVLETFVNKHQDNDYFVKFNCPEFTSLCPITGQPDFAGNPYQLFAGCEDGGKQESETVSVQFPQPR